MFKFIKQYAETMHNIDVYPLFSLLVFFIFFLVLLWMVKSMDRKQVEHLSNIPFDKKQQSNQTN